MKRIRIIIAVLLSAICGSETFAQEKVTGDISADIVSRYIWRGQALADASIQPTASLSYQGFSLSAWANYGFLNTKDTKEFDLNLSYQTGGFNVGITDYWFSINGFNNRYFSYKAHDTKHVWEANVGYDFGPVAVQWFTNFAGDDGYSKSGSRAYSSYFEISAPFTLAGCDWTAKLGGVPFNTSLYSDAHSDMTITNVSLRVSKDIKLGHCSLPVFMEGICNPSTEKGYLVVGTTLDM